MTNAERNFLRNVTRMNVWERQALESDLRRIITVSDASHPAAKDATWQLALLETIR